MKTYAFNAFYDNGNSVYHGRCDLEDGMTREEEEEAITSALPTHVRDALDNVTYWQLERKN